MLEALLAAVNRLAAVESVEMDEGEGGSLF
jgi:hypothetical protein